MQKYDRVENDIMKFLLILWIIIGGNIYITAIDRE